MTYSLIIIYDYNFYKYLYDGIKYCKQTQFMLINSDSFLPAVIFFMLNVFIVLHLYHFK